MHSIKVRNCQNVAVEIRYCELSWVKFLAHLEADQLPYTARTCDLAENHVPEIRKKGQQLFFSVCHLLF